MRRGSGVIDWVYSGFVAWKQEHGMSYTFPKQLCRRLLLGVHDLPSFQSEVINLSYSKAMSAAHDSMVAM